MMINFSPLLCNGSRLSCRSGESGGGSLSGIEPGGRRGRGDAIIEWYFPDSDSALSFSVPGFGAEDVATLPPFPNILRETLINPKEKIPVRRP